MSGKNREKGLMVENKVYQNHNFQIVSGAGLLMMMGVSMIVPAFPRIAASLGVSEQSVGLLITGSTLPSFIFMPLAGVMADRFGRKRILVPSLFLFGMLGTGCAFAPDFKTLLILRIIQGIAIVPMGGLTNAIIGDLFSGQKRAEAMGLITTIMYIGYIIYPLIGGALANLSWNYTFLPFALAIPLGFLALAYLHCPEPKSEQSLRDYLGEALHYLKSLKVLWLFSASVLTYVLLFGAYLTYFSLLLAGRFQASPFTIGLYISAVGLITAIVSSQTGRLGKRFSAVSLITGAFVIYAFSMAIIPVLPNLWLCIAATVLFGIAHGLNLPSQQVIAAGVAPFEHRAGFMAVNGTMVFLGMTLGPLVMGLAFSLTNLNVTFFTAAAIALIIPAMSLMLGRDRLAVT